jgi:4-amino-4-deoxy-L-arabinose transferase-like glycosyltransferase
VLENGDVLAPTWNGQPWFVHPPLSTWITVPFYAALGVSEASERLPMALAAMATVLLTFVLGSRIGGRRAGLLAALVLAATPRFWLYSRQLAGDVYLTTLLVGAFVLARPALSRPGEGRGRLVLAYGLVGLGVLAKGPVAGLLFGVPLLLSARLGRPRVPIRSLLPWTGLLLALVVGFSWSAFMWHRFGDEFLAVHYGHHHFQRFLSDDVGSREPWYYLFAILGDGQPWVMILPLAIARAWMSGDRRPEAMLPWWFAAFAFAFFSASLGKRNVYLLPIYPALAIGYAPVLLECWDGARRRLARFAGAFLAVGSAGAGVLLVVAARRGPASGGAEIPMTVVCFAAAAAALAGSIRASGRVVVAGIVGGALALQATSALLLPTLSRYRPVPRLAAALVREAQPGDAAVVYGASIHSLGFYAQRRTRAVSGPVENLAAAVPEGRRAFVLCYEEVAGRVLSSPAVEAREVDRAPYLVFQFRRLVRGEGKPMKDLVLLAVQRPEAPTGPPR